MENALPLRFYNYLARVVFLCLAFAVLFVGVVILTVGYSSDGNGTLILGCVITLLGAVGTVFGLYQTLLCKPYLEIDADGVRLRQQEAVLIRWAEIKEGEVVERHGMLFLMLHFANAGTMNESKVLRDFKSLVETISFEDGKPLPADSLPIPLLGKTIDRERILDVVRQKTKVEKAGTP